MERTMIYTIEDEKTAREGLSEDCEFVVEIDPYGGKRVNKHYPKLIEQATNENENVKAHFPLEPFHYREVKRHGTQIAMDACVEYNVPMSLETQKEVPIWAMENLTRHKMSEIRIGMNTFDKKRWKALNPMSSEPAILRESFTQCFNCGIYTILTVSPVVAGIISMYDIFEVVDAFKYWTKGVEIYSKSFTVDEFKSSRDAFLAKKLGDISDYYIKSGDLYIIEPSYWDSLTNKLDKFLIGTKLGLTVKE